MIVRYIIEIDADSPWSAETAHSHLVDACDDITDEVDGVSVYVVGREEEETKGDENG